MGFWHKCYVVSRRVIDRQRFVMMLGFLVLNGPPWVALARIVLREPLRRVKLSRVKAPVDFVWLLPTRRRVYIVGD